MTRAWWRGAVFYQIYVRSFADSNDDGVGDLPGITSRLEYVKSLGVDAIWLTPFYPSPQKDHGYDVAGYVDVNPEYGTLEDFDRLVQRAHDLGLKVLVDIVPNHTSDQHPWFKAALSSPDDPHRARYHFADGKPDGSPPNNWGSAFGGPAWTREEAGSQWYLHLFAPEQPDLNWWSPDVPVEFEAIIKFWLDRGADGFRIDVASALFKRADLADRPLVPNRVTGTLEPDPAFSIFDQPQLHDVYRRWRQIADGYEPDRVLVGEIFEPRRHSIFVASDQLDTAFAFMQVPWDATRWRRSIGIWRRALKSPGFEPSWTLSNHDVVRQVTRFGGGNLGRSRARAALLLVLGLPGQVFFFQGEELGLERGPTCPGKQIRTLSSCTAAAATPVATAAACRCPGDEACRTLASRHHHRGCRCPTDGTGTQSTRSWHQADRCSSTTGALSPCAGAWPDSCRTGSSGAQRRRASLPTGAAAWSWLATSAGGRPACRSAGASSSPAVRW